MELILSIEKSFDKTGEFLIKDGSTWGTPLRSTRKLICLVERFQQDHYDSLLPEKVIPNAIATAATEWKVTTDKDGYFQILLVSASDHNLTIPYILDQVVYGSTDSHTGLFVSMDANVPTGTLLSDTYFWVPVEKIEDFPLLVVNGTDFLCKDHVHDLMSRVCIAEKALKYAGNPCDCPDETMTKDYFWSLIFHHAAVYSAAFSEFKESGKFLDKVIDRCTNGSAPDKEDCGCHD